MKLEVFAGLLLLLAGSANAQEATPATDWTGFYAGVGLSASQLKIDPNDASPDDDVTIYWNGPVNGYWSVATTELIPTLRGSSGGALLAGYGVQQASSYRAVEGELDLGGAVSADTELSYPMGQGSLFVDSCAASELCAVTDKALSVDVLGRFRGLAGVVIAPSVMGFAAAGVALARVDASATAQTQTYGVDSLDSANASELIAGLTLGVGVEIKPTENLRLRAETLIDSFSWSYDLDADVPYHCYAYCAASDASMAGTASFANTSARLSAIWQF